ncbi:MAG: 50S ribosomal protein L11 methyltransferase [Clostridia bacterium]|nr:50S ribosomal protein L11 methyltransferase [Clostridia bacterium]
MRWIEAAFKTTSEEIDTLCDRLTELGAESLVIEDEADFRDFLEKNHQYWDYVDDDLMKRYSGVSRVKLYASDDETGRAMLSSMTEALGIEPETDIVDDADWQDNWKQYYKPVEVGETLLILPQWEPIPPESDKRLLRLDPGLAFGTGSHATTRMCLCALEDAAANEKFVLDIGCGSGILGIGALVLGCAFVAGCDIDSNAPRISMENAKLNGISEMVFQIFQGDILSDAPLRETLGKGYDIVLANIVADVIIPLSPIARDTLKPGGTFICSGIIDGREEEVRKALDAAGFSVTGHRHEDGWHCFTAVTPQQK